MRQDEFHPIYADGSFVLGQEQDGQPFGGFFDENQGFSGKLSQVEIWNTELTPVEVYNLANCILSTVRPQNRVVTWGTNKWVATNVKIKDVPLKSFCEKNIISNYFIWPEEIDFEGKISA